MLKTEPIMTFHPLALLALVLAHPALAQTVVFSENFDSGAPGPQWLSTSQGPFIIGDGYFSPYSIGITSQDLNLPPLAAPYLSYLFHPIPFDVNADYELRCAVRVDDPLNTGSEARAYLGWVDPLAPDYLFCMGFGNCCDPWQFGGTSNFCWTQPSPNHAFGVVLTLLDGSSDCTAYFDNVSVIDNNLFNGIADASALPALSVAPNPVVDEARLSFPEAFTGTIAIRDAQGRLLRAQSVNGQRTTTVPVADLPSGVLLVQCIGAAGTTVQRFVKY